VPAYVIVQWAPGTRMPSARARGDARGVREFNRLLKRHHGAVLPQASQHDDGETGAAATIQVSDMATANELAAALRDLEGVESAYAKPAEEPP
jgi:hypothetical protein